MGIVVWVLAILYAHLRNLQYDPMWPYFAEKIYAMFTLPAVPLGLFMGWLWGKSMKKYVIILLALVIVLIGALAIINH